MMRSLKSFAIILLTALLSSAAVNQNHQVKWYTDFDTVMSIAQKEDKLIFMRFQGSDWCANCWRMDTALFEQPVFEKFAEEKFVLLALDFPAKAENKLPAAQAEHNQQLLEKYNPSKGFPAAFILSAKGKSIGQLSVTPNPTEWYMDNLKKILGGH